ncbi:hypothetical protein CYG48_16290 [Neorhizobium sp. SOG26]|uniref:sensor histidine kinase n=1 Tax=Neorhizobium sp. SOG26 TaxID=2060726 RepID=UPI000E57FCB4|nr:histidine kinase dimerization/phosphoacceptor domain -containing protein [Neorhizobium sp. SOG26]AXV17112.1 hypothetical protein CYG48_16290 [Neorhizobium sp. SOG26]
MAEPAKADQKLMRAARPALPIWLAAIFLAALTTVAAFIVVENYRTALRDGETRALSSAHVVAAHLQWMIEASDQALQRIEAEVADRPIASVHEYADELTRAVGEMPDGFQYTLMDETGRVVFSSGPVAPGINHSDRTYFTMLRDGQELAFSRALMDEFSGKPSFLVARRIDRNNTFAGVASINIPNESLDRFWASLDLGPDSTISAVRDDGWLVARRPAAARAVDISTTDWFPLTREQDNGVYHSAVSPIDGHARIVAFWKVSGAPLIALAAIERQEMLDQFWRNLWSDAVIILPLMAVLIFAAAWINRLLYRTAARNEALEEALERNRFLLREIHHRVKNNLQAVLALIRLQPMPVEAREDMSRRVAAMIAVHEQIYRTDQFERVEVAPYAERLVREIASSYDLPVAIELKLEPLTVDREQALPLGMIINEVVSNAFKYAFAGRTDGRLGVELHQDGDDFRLVIRDNGPGMDVTAEASGGMGSRLIASFVRQIGGEYSTLTNGGAVFEMTAPLRQDEEEPA